DGGRASARGAAPLRGVEDGGSAQLALRRPPGERRRTHGAASGDGGAASLPPLDPGRRGADAHDDPRPRLRQSRGGRCARLGDWRSQAAKTRAGEGGDRDDPARGRRRGGPGAPRALARVRGARLRRPASPAPSITSRYGCSATSRAWNAGKRSSPTSL
ncbi:MAG: hypothetical protein AVDCRST_MAG49-1496, partial [uncultured Thermomicrobiales bacterium]